MKRIVLNVTGQLCRDVVRRKELVQPAKAIADNLQKLWEEYLMEEPGTPAESRALNGIATCVYQCNSVYTHLLIPAMSAVKLAKLQQLIKPDNVLQYIPS